MESKTTVRLLRRELDSWRPFTEALREDDRKLAREMLERCWRYVEAIESSGKTYLVEPLFLTVLLAQEKRIRALERELGALRDETEAWKSRAGS